jgi:light-regulated signal transduction histidine kinase (bacteriophytochrome)
MNFREFGETAVMYLTGIVGEPLQKRDKGLNFNNRISPKNTPYGISTIGGKGLKRGGSDRLPCQSKHNSPRQLSHRNQRHSPDPTSWKEIAMARANYIDGRHEGLINGEEETSGPPVSIQSHCAAIVIREPELTILQVSENTGAHLGFAPEELTGQPLSLLLGETEFERMREEFLSKDLDSGPHYLPAARVGKGARLFELALHRRGGLLILECEPKLDDANTWLDLPSSLNSAIARMRRAESVGEACQTAVDEARRFTGFDRVMVYKFKGDGSGAVIAESLGGDFKSCLGLRYPASNITQQAQTIYRSGRSLMKVDMNDRAVSLVPPVNPVAGAPLDMSCAVTRDLSPAYSARLRKTGVTALMFISITKNDRLWGLLMFYNHTGPKHPSHDARMACELLGHYLSLQITAKDEAENYEYMARIVKLNTELERSNVELDSFVCVASHDLKEPLRGIHRYSDFLMEDYADKLDEAGVEKLRTLVKLSRRMETLVDSLLHFSRAGRADLAMRAVDLDEVVSETLETIAPRLQESGAEIRRPQRLPIIRADRTHVGEIFHNLIVNSIKYNDKPLKWVEIGWDEGDGNREWGVGSGEWEQEGEGVGGQGEGEKVRTLSPSPHLSHSPLTTPHSPVFYVRDNGIGIPERHYETIFGIFRRLHEREEFGGGVGAGLTIVKKIVERHNGRIWVESCVGAGTTVYFTLG